MQLFKRTILPATLIWEMFLALETGWRELRSQGGAMVTALIAARH